MHKDVGHKLVSEELFGMRDLLNLAWSLPACKKCEVQEGGICRWKNGTNNKFDCFGGKPDSGTYHLLPLPGPFLDISRRSASDRLID